VKEKKAESRLVTGCLEGISKRVFADFSAQIAELAGEKPGIYALYHRGKLYYVGLATDLRRRIKHHLEDKHARNWDTFSLYVVRKEAHLRDLEAMTIRIAKPKGNGIKGGRLESLTPELKTLIDEWNLRRTSRILGLTSNDKRTPNRRRAAKTRVPLNEREFDTIVCAAGVHRQELLVRNPHLGQGNPEAKVHRLVRHRRGQGHHALRPHQSHSPVEEHRQVCRPASRQA
jgi:hypothetical protein